MNARHFARLQALRDGDGAGTPVQAADDNVGSRYIRPTVLVDTDPCSAIMSEEIFGPLLPVLAVSGADSAISFINAREKALAAYVFAEEPSVSDRFSLETSSGGVCVNAALIHAVPPEPPFGGVGASGMGAYHGRHGFDQLSHLAVLTYPTSSSLDWLMPPYPAPRASRSAASANDARVRAGG